jgi:uncharacterized protein (DUF486 family)
LFRLLPVALLFTSNVFMTFAWYGHLGYRERPLWLVILASWCIALPEYCFAVPANRLGSYHFSGVELKAMQEVITLSVFAIFSVVYLGQPDAQSRAWVRPHRAWRRLRLQWTILSWYELALTNDIYDN